jgi:hypothetical protein
MSIVLATGAVAGDIVDIVAYGAFLVADTYTQAAADAKFVAKTNTSETFNTPVLVTPNITTGLNLSGAEGTSGQALLSQGSGNAPVWGTAGISTGKAIAMAIVFGS